MPRNLRATNTRSILRRRTRPGDAMASYDRLPPDLRQWLAQAVLPWSARSALRVWHKALSLHAGDVGAALAHLSEIERDRLWRDARAVWGETHPAARPPARACPPGHPKPSGPDGLIW